MLITTDYRSFGAVGQTDLKKCHEDPLLFYQTSVAHTREPDPPTEQMLFGQDVEDFLLNGKLTQIVVIPTAVLAKNGARSGYAWKEFAAQHEGQRLIKQHELEDRKVVLQQIARNVAAHEKAYSLVMGGGAKKKVPIAWRWNDCDLKSEIDILHPHCIVDIKTTSDNSPAAFSRQVASLGYFIQAAMYQLAVWHEFGGDFLPFVLVAIKNKPSYCVEVYKLSEAAVEEGRRELLNLIHFYKSCQEHNEWQSETWGGIYELDLPKWHTAQMNDWNVA